MLGNGRLFLLALLAYFHFTVVVVKSIVKTIPAQPFLSAGGGVKNHPATASMDVGSAFLSIKAPNYFTGNTRMFGRTAKKLGESFLSTQ